MDQTAQMTEIARVSDAHIYIACGGEPPWYVMCVCVCVCVFALRSIYYTSYYHNSSLSVEAFREVLSIRQQKHLTEWLYYDRVQLVLHDGFVAEVAMKMEQHAHNKHC